MQRRPSPQIRIRFSILVHVDGGKVGGILPPDQYDVCAAETKEDAHTRDTMCIVDVSLARMMLVDVIVTSTYIVTIF